jgi:chromosome segregation ATPase
MAINLTDLLSRIVAKCDLLRRRCRQLLDENRQLKDEIVEANAECERLKSELVKANKQIEYLQISHKLDGSADSSQDMSNGRKILADLVRKIDKCIARLESE